MPDQRTVPNVSSMRNAMQSRRTLGHCVGAFWALALLSCGDATAPAPDDTRGPTDLRVLTVSPTAPPLATTQASFYAVQGKNAGVDLWYHARPGQRDSTKFLEFRLGGSSLDRRPDGSVIAPGDSVLISVRVTDPLHLIVDFQPSGLLFSPRDLPRLRLFFGEVGDDLNGDGHVDSNDDALLQQLSIWRQEAPGLPWFRLSSAVVKESREVEASLGGFTGYAIEY